ncbi:MAG: Exosortase, partial [Planctomycetota bacterium]
MSALWFVALPLLVAYASALWWCVELWSLPEGYFAHGPLVPAVMAYVVWSRRAEWRKVAASPDVRGFWLLGPALLLHLCGAALSIDSVSAASLVLAIPGAAWVAVGRARLQGMWPALWMFAFAAPLPIYVTDRIAFELKEVAVHGGVWLAQATGLGIERDGASLLVEGQTQALDVADPCGGLRSLLAMITLVYCVAFFLGPPQALRRIALMLVAAPIAVLVNVVRIAAICWLAKGYGVPFATGTGHDVMNGIAWVLDLALVLALDALLTRRSGQGDGTPAASKPVAMPARSMRLPRVAAWLWPLCLCLCALSFTRAEPS